MATGMAVIEPPAAAGLGTASSRHTGASIPAPAIIGRAPELGVLLERMASARRGEGAILFVTGEAGIGKSRLCRELAARAGGTMEYLHGAGSPLLPEAPFGPFVDALRAWLRGLSAEAVRGMLGSSLPEIGRLLPELAAVTTPPLS
ncbi:MAG: AAA family ATPase, partial [Dehalococcoidia bacterium]